jgi:hypothetical protein
VRGHGREPAGHALDQQLTERLALGGHDNCVGSREEHRQLLVRLPAGEKHTRHLQPRGDLCGMLALPLAVMAADEHKSSRRLQIFLRASERPDQTIESFYDGEPPDVEQHRSRHAVVGGFFVRPQHAPLGQLQINGQIQPSVAFDAPRGDVRACVHLADETLRIARRDQLGAEPTGDFLQAGLLLIAGGRRVIADGEDPEGFSAAVAALGSGHVARSHVTGWRAGPRMQRLPAHPRTCRKAGGCSPPLRPRAEQHHAAARVRRPLIRHAVPRQSSFSPQNTATGLPLKCSISA